MLIFDEIKKNDPQLRTVAMTIAGGFFILLIGLWWVQIVSAGEYKNHLETQSYRTVRIPAMRGKILDCEGRVLAQNSPHYNLSLFFGGLSDDFQNEYTRLRPVVIVKKSRPIWQFWARRSSIVTNRVSLSKDNIGNLKWWARYNVASNIVNKMSETIGRPLTFDFKSFARAYQSSLYVPYPIVQGLSPDEVARFEEGFSGNMGVDLDVQTTRIYPYGTTAAHLLGYVQKDDSSDDEDESFNYRLPDYRGVVGIEGGCNKELHGHAGEEFVMVNNQGYRQTENVGSEPEPGHNVVLTLDLDIQRAAEQSLVKHQGADARSAIIVMNCRTGDILAMVSSPTVDPNYFTKNLSPDEMQKQYELLINTNLTPQINRATYENYAPGSIFKPIVGLAALEDGLDPAAEYHVEANPEDPDKGCVYIGNRKIRDTAPPGDYNFKRAIERSSNSYFIYNGYRRIQKVVEMADKFHFGEKTGIGMTTSQETRGKFPSLKKIQSSDWHDGDSANICFGQGDMAVTPIQMAVAYSAIANGGTVLWPRMVERIESQDPDSGEAPTFYPSGVVRDRIGVSERSLKIVHDAMLGETEDEEGTGKSAVVPGLRICGKTGTAQIENEKGEFIGYNVWFASFAPYENPKYVVLVMVQKFPASGSGGTVCAPIAHDIYAEIVKKDPTVLSESVAMKN
jgi:penicillin-binding protein 2